MSQQSLSEMADDEDCLCEDGMKDLGCFEHFEVTSDE